MRPTIVTSLGLFALQALAAPAEKRQAKKASLAEMLLGERIDALIDRTGGQKAIKLWILRIWGWFRPEKIVEVLRTFPAGERSQQMKDFTAKVMNRRFFPLIKCAPSSMLLTICSKWWQGRRPCRCSSSTGCIGAAIKGSRIPNH